MSRATVQRVARLAASLTMITLGYVPADIAHGKGAKKVAAKPAPAAVQDDANDTFGENRPEDPSKQDMVLADIITDDPFGGAPPTDMAMQALRDRDGESIDAVWANVDHANVDLGAELKSATWAEPAAAVKHKRASTKVDLKGAPDTIEARRKQAHAKAALAAAVPRAPHTPSTPAALTVLSTVGTQALAPGDEGALAPNIETSDASATGSGFTAKARREGAELAIGQDPIAKVPTVAVAAADAVQAPHDNRVVTNGSTGGFADATNGRDPGLRDSASEPATEVAQVPTSIARPARTAASAGQSATNAAVSATPEQPVASTADLAVVGNQARLMGTRAPMVARARVTPATGALRAVEADDISTPRAPIAAAAAVASATLSDDADAVEGAASVEDLRPALTTALAASASVPGVSHLVSSNRATDASRWLIVCGMLALVGAFVTGGQVYARARASAPRPPETPS